MGLAKRGYPGVILLAAAAAAAGVASPPTSSSRKAFPEGSVRAQHGVSEGVGEGGGVERLEEVGRRIKRMQWASQDLRPVRILRSSSFARLQRVLADRQGVHASADVGSAAGTGSAAKGKRKLPLLLFLDSMKEISALFHEADQLLSLEEEGEGAKAGQTGKGSPLRPDQELWRDIWRREMRPR